jgi:hypothetical protein
VRTRHLGLAVFSGLFVIETLIVQGVELTPFQWIMLGFAASMSGRAAAYLSILEWLRVPFVIVVPHPSNAGEDTEPRYSTGWRAVIGELLCCPVCSGTWGAAIILMIYKFFPAWGEAILFTLSAASLAWLITFLTQWVEWKTHEARFHTGLMSSKTDSVEKESLKSNGYSQRQP